MFAPQRNTTIKTPFGLVSIAAKSIVLVMCTQNALAIYNLHDTKSGAVSVQTGGNRLAIAPGRHLLVSSSVRGDFADLNNAQALTYRNIRSGRISGDEGIYLRTFTAEFNHSQSLATIMPVRKLLASNDARAKHLAASILKTGAILQQFNSNSSGEAFQPMLRPSMVAWANRY